VPPLPAQPTAPSQPAPPQSTPPQAAPSHAEPPPQAPPLNPAPPLPPPPVFLQTPTVTTAAPGPKAGGPAPARRGPLIAIAGAVVLLLGVVALGTALVLRPGADDSRLRAEPSSAAADDVALPPGPSQGAGPPAAGQQPGDPSQQSPIGVRPTAPASDETDATNGAGSNPTGSNPASATPATQAPATQEPATQAPPTEAPAPPAPATKAPATKAPATKAPATKAPAPKAPEIDKAVAKSGKRGAGPCSAKLVGGYGCLQTYGDIWWVYDTKADSHSAVVFWEVGSGSAKRTGQCANSMGNGKIGACNKNYPEKVNGRAKVCIMDWDTKQMHGCTAYFSFKTG